MSGWIGVLLGVLGLVGIAGGVIAYFRVSVTKSTIDNYRQANDSLEARVKTLEADNKDAKQHQATCEAQLEAQKQVNELLAGRVEGTVAIKSLQEAIEKKFDDLLEGQDHMAEAVGGLVYDMRRQAGLDYPERRHD